MKKAAFRWTATIVVIFINFLFWLIPSDLAYNVAQQRDILLGRYTVGKFTTLIILAVISFFVIRGIWSKKKPHRRQGTFKFIAVTLSIILCIILVDIVLRISQGQFYVSKKTYYHRTPNRVIRGVFTDQPPTAFTYPFAPDGFADNNYIMTIDSRGFRNKTDLAEYDIITIGDSFVEGSGLSDEQCWLPLLAKETGKTVYNLGISGGSPVTMLETLKKFAIDLSPKTIVCMLYEGNDFRASNFDPRKESRLTLKFFYDSSPLRLSIKKFFIDVFGPINCNRRKGPAVRKSLTSKHSLYPVSLMPLSLPADNPKYYTFKVKALAAHYIREQDFLDSDGCKQTFEVLRQMKKLCDDNNIRLIVVYAPDKPNVLLPIAAESLSPQLLHAFLSLRVKDLPLPGELKKLILQRLPVIESATQQFCLSESIEFISLTQPLQEQILKSQQCYFTYDQHWTPVGHEVAASVIAAYLENQ